MSLFDRRYETMPAPELEQFQLERLQALLGRLRRNVRRHRERLADVRVQSLADLARLPLTTPEDLVSSFPYGMFAFPLREVIRLHSTHGPGGRPLIIGHTRNDLSQWGTLVARQLCASGVTANDVIQISLAGAAHPGASGYLLGAEVLEASVIAEDPLHLDHQVAILQNYRPTVLITTPTNALDLGRELERRRVDPQSFQLRAVLLTRPVPPETRDQLAAGLFTTVQCNFGVPEVLDPGLCVECETGQFHLHEDQFLAEIVQGELVLTTLGREAMPLLRYRTRIAAQLRREPCACGRTGAIIVPGEALDGRLRVGETNFYDAELPDVLAQTRAAGHAFKMLASDRLLVIEIEMSERLFEQALFTPTELKREIESEILARLGVDTEVRFVQPATSHLPL